MKDRLTKRTRSCRPSSRLGVLLVTLSTALSSNAIADLKAISAQECKLSELPYFYWLFWHGWLKAPVDYPVSIERHTGMIRLQGAGPGQVECPVERDTTNPDLTLAYLRVYAEPGAGDCWTWARTTTGSVLDFNGGSLDADGSTLIQGLDVSGSTTTAFSMSCVLYPGKKMYGYRYDEN